MFNTWLVGLLGIWMVIVPFTRMSTYGNEWNNWIVGVFAAIFGSSISAGTQHWRQPLAVAVGAWLIISGCSRDLTMGPGSFTNDVTVGVLLMALSFSRLGSTKPIAPPPATRR